MKKDKKKLESTEEIFSSEEWNAAFSGTDAVEVSLIADKSRLLSSKLLPHSKLDKELDKQHSKLDKEQHSKLDKEKTIVYQLDKEIPSNWITTEQQPHSKLDKQPHSKLDTKLDKEPHSKLDKIILKSKKRTVREVVGIQRKILLKLHQITQQNGGRETPVFTRKSLSEELSVNYFSVRTAIQRFREWGILENVTSSKGGRNAPVIVTFSISSFQELNWITTEQQPHSKLDTKLDKTGSSSSSYTNFNKTTTTSTQNLDALDLSEIEEYGFSKNHASQLWDRNKFESLEQLQMSLNHMAFYLKMDAAKNIREPLNFIMKELNRGYYETPVGYKSRQQIQREKFQMDKMEENKKLEEIEKKIEDEEFKSWRMKLSEKEKESILIKLKVNRKFPEIAIESTLKNHFKENRIQSEQI